MADISRYPRVDIDSMMSEANVALWEVERVWTDPLLDAKMADWRSGDIGLVAKPTPGLQSPGTASFDAFLNGISSTTFDGLESIGEMLGGAVSTVGDVVSGLADGAVFFSKNIKVIALVAAGIGGFLIYRSLR